MSLDAQYQVFHAMPDTGKVQTLRAHQTASGREVMVHLILSDAAGVDRQVRALPTAKADLILAQGIHSGKPAVVTEVLPHGIPFEEWLEPGTIFHTGRWVAPGAAPEPAG